MSTIPVGIHPYCIFDMMTDQELDAMGADMKKRGLLLAIIVTNIMPDGSISKDWWVLDGKNRWEVCKRYGIKPRFEQYTGNDPLGFVISMDMRRHRTPEQRKAAIGKLLLANPSKSDSKIADQTGTSRNTVKTEREKLEAQGEIPPAPKREGKDGTIQPTSEAGCSPEQPGDDDGTKVETPKPKSHKKKEQKAPTTKSDALNDELGQPVPDHLRDVFGDKWLGELVAKANDWSLDMQARSIKTKLAGKGQAYIAYLRTSVALGLLEKAVEAIDELSETLLAGLPHCVCKACSGKGCDLCRKTGWLPLWRFEELEKTT